MRGKLPNNIAPKIKALCTCCGHAYVCKVCLTFSVPLHVIHLLAGSCKSRVYSLTLHSRFETLLSQVNNLVGITS